MRLIKMLVVLPILVPVMLIMGIAKKFKCMSFLEDGLGYWIDFAYRNTKND